MPETTSSSENSLVKVSDLLGISEPLTKLVEYTCKGIGVLWKPVQIKREARAEAEAVKILGDAIVDPQHIPLEINYKGETLQLRFDGDQAPSLPISARATQRLIANETRKQENIESVVQFAAEQLKDEESVPEQEVDEDWATRFFKYAEDVSSEQMKQLWGRVLAGKIKAPGSFGLRTLDFLRSVSVGEAQKFDRIGKFVVSQPGRNGKKFLLKNMAGDRTKPIIYDDVLALGEIDLLLSDPMLVLEFKLEPNQGSQFIVGSKVLLFKAKEKAFTINIGMHPLTKIGRELLDLSEDVGSDSRTLTELLKLFKRPDVEVSVGDLGEPLGNGQFRVSNVEVYTEEMLGNL